MIVTIIVWLLKCLNDGAILMWCWCEGWGHTEYGAGLSSPVVKVWCGDWGRPPAYKLLRVCTVSHADIYVSQQTDGELGKPFILIIVMVWPVAFLCLICLDFTLHFAFLGILPNVSEDFCVMNLGVTVVIVIQFPIFIK